MTISGRRANIAWLDEMVNEVLASPALTPTHTTITWHTGTSISSHRSTLRPSLGSSNVTSQSAPLEKLDQASKDRLADWVKAFDAQVAQADEEDQAEEQRRAAIEERARIEREKTRAAAKEIRLAEEAQARVELEALPNFGMF